MHPVSRAIFAGTALALLACAAPRPAAAIEVECIEASKYKYLWQLFDNDPKKFAAYLQIDPAKLPGPELCRAVFLTGGIHSRVDVDKLIDAITANRGWLATIYLASGGGDSGLGRRLAELVRMFWLKTQSFTRLPVAYRPDFIVPPLGTWGPRAAPGSTEKPADDPAFAAAWQAYQKVIDGLPQIGKADGPAHRCMSSCSSVFTAGIDRQGIVYVHRPRRSKSKDAKDFGNDLTLSMADTVQYLQRAEQAQVSLYQQMDAGEEFIRIYQSTPTNIISPATGARTPRYVADLLLARCGSDAAQLQDLDSQLRGMILEIENRVGAFVDTNRLRMALASVHERRIKVEQCVADAHERERLNNFAKLCGQGCDHKRLQTMIDDKLRDITPGAASPPAPQGR